MSKILELNDVSTRYKDFALGNISLSLDEGIFLGVVGPNGAGKTTLKKTEANAPALFINVLIYPIRRFPRNGRTF